MVVKKEPIVCARRKVRRNEPCPFCTSGKKFKKCHGATKRTETTGADGSITVKTEPLGPMVIR